jgi:hypothetical protein
MKENAASDGMFLQPDVGAILFQNRENQKADTRPCHRPTKHQDNLNRGFPDRNCVPIESPIGCEEIELPQSPHQPDM